MPSIIPVPVLRSSDALVNRRLLAQIQSDQLSLLRIQDRISTGRRIQVPSEDAPAAVRAIGLQRLLEQKTQSIRNLISTQSNLGASDAAIGGVSDLIIDIRALALSMVDNTRTDIERDGAAAEIGRSVEQLLNDANRRFRDRSLFAGTAAGVTPFSVEGAFIAFNGDSGSLPSYADIGMLFQSNVTAQEVFGAFSDGVQSFADLNPIVTEQTRLIDLRGGQGITTTSILVSDGNNSSTIDVSGAETVGDVVDLLQANPPEGRRITARAIGNRLQVELDVEGGGNLNIREGGGGTTAAELGIFEANGVGVAPLVGDDLNPILRNTTPLDNLLGVQATAVLRSGAAAPGLPELSNDIYFEAKLRGAEYNDYDIHYVDDEALQAAPGLLAGTETARLETTATASRAALAFGGLNNNLILTADTAGAAFNGVRIVVAGGTHGAGASASFDVGNQTLTVEIDSGGTSEIQNVIAAIDANTPFTATYDASDPADGGYLATATVGAADIGNLETNTGNSGGDENTIFIHIDAGSTTAGHVVSALEAAADVTALFNLGLDEKDEASGLVPAGAGIVNVNTTATTANGEGAELDQASGFLITNGETTHTIDISDAETVEDLLDTLNGSSAFVRAEINAEGSSINIRSRLSGADLYIGENGGQTATQLGVRTFTEATLLSDLNHGSGVGVDEDVDFTIRRSIGVEVDVNISTAVTVGDVISLINTAAGEDIAQLASSGNGIQIVESNPTGGVALSVVKAASSSAAWDLGLIEQGQDEAYSTDGPAPVAASALITFTTPDNRDNAFQVTSTQPGTLHNGVQIVIDGSGTTAEGLAVYDSGAGTLTITIDPAQSTANDVVNAINDAVNIPFEAELDLTSDPGNDGTGLIPATGIVGLTSDGTLNSTAERASVVTAFAPPFTLNSFIQIEAVDAGIAYNDVVVEFRDTLVGDVATASYDSGAKRLTIDVQVGVTSANTVITALGSVAEFNATLDLETDATNNGSGPVRGGQFTLAGGTPEVLQADDVNPFEVQSVFNTLLKLRTALNESDLAEIERLVNAIDTDFRRVNFSRAEIGARQNALDSLRVRLEDEDVELRRTLSLEIDVDLVEAISDLMSRQSAFEASLRLIGQTLQLNLLQYL